LTNVLFIVSDDHGWGDLQAKHSGGLTLLDSAIMAKHPETAAHLRTGPETADLIRKHGGKTGEELKAEGK
jgi:hypothetical protein